MNTKSPEQVDRDIGHAIRGRRIAMRLSQSKLAEAVGVTFQQVQKYENGKNRISGSRLVKVATALECAATDLLRGKVAPGIMAQSPEAELLTSAEGSRLAKAFAAIPVGLSRTALLKLAEAIARLGS